MLAKHMSSKPPLPAYGSRLIYHDTFPLDKYHGCLYVDSSDDSTSSSSHNVHSKISSLVVYKNPVMSLAAVVSIHYVSLTNSESYQLYLCYIQLALSTHSTMSVSWFRSEYSVCLQRKHPSRGDQHRVKKN